MVVTAVRRSVVPEMLCKRDTYFVANGIYLLFAVVVLL